MGGVSKDMQSKASKYPLMSTPIDRTAARVVSKGDHYEPNITGPIPCETFDTCPPLISTQGLGLGHWIGTRHDRMVIVGLFEHKPKGGTNHRWIARCDCGKYEVRRHEKWRKEKDVYDDRCLLCKTIQVRKRNYERTKHFEATGCWPED